MYFVNLYLYPTALTLPSESLWELYQSRPLTLTIFLKLFIGTRPSISRISILLSRSEGKPTKVSKVPSGTFTTFILATEIWKLEIYTSWLSLGGIYHNQLSIPLLQNIPSMLGIFHLLPPVHLFYPLNLIVM